MPGLATFLGGMTGGGGTSTPGGGDPLPATMERLYEGGREWGEPFGGRHGKSFQYYVPAAEKDAEIERIIGTVETFSSIWGGSVARRVPWQHPDYAGLYATRYQAEGMGRSSPSSLYSWYKFTVDFETPEWQATGDTPFMAIRREASASVVTLPGRFLRMQSDNFRLEHDQGIPIPQVAYVVTVFGVSAVNPTAIANALAAPMNSATLYLPGASIAPGYALFQGVADQNDFGLSGNVVKSVTYRFLFRSGLRFDQIIHPRTGVVDEPLRPDGAGLVAASDLNALFL